MSLPLAQASAEWILSSGKPISLRRAWLGCWGAAASDLAANMFGMVFFGRVGRVAGSPVPLRRADDEADGARVSCGSGVCETPVDTQDSVCAFGSKKEVVLLRWIRTCAGSGAHWHVAVHRPSFEPLNERER